MPTMPDRARSAYEAEMYDAQTAITDAQRWDHLERAHLLAESDRWPHLRTHTSMLKLALRARDRGEIRNQLTVLATIVVRGDAADRCHADTGDRQVAAAS